MKLYSDDVDERLCLLGEAEAEGESHHVVWLFEDEHSRSIFSRKLQHLQSDPNEVMMTATEPRGVVLIPANLPLSEHLHSAISTWLLCQTPLMRYYDP